MKLAEETNRMYLIICSFDDLKKNAVIQSNIHLCHCTVVQSGLRSLVAKKRPSRHLLGSWSESVERGRGGEAAPRSHIRRQAQRYLERVGERMGIVLGRYNFLCNFESLFISHKFKDC